MSGVFPDPASSAARRNYSPSPHNLQLIGARRFAGGMAWWPSPASGPPEALPTPSRLAVMTW